MLDRIIGVNEAAELWQLSPGTIKNYCARGRIKAKKVGKTWIIDKEQPNPSKKEGDVMALIQCISCKEKIIENDDDAILECPHCGSTAIQVLKE